MPTSPRAFTALPDRNKRGSKTGSNVARGVLTRHHAEREARIRALLQRQVDVARREFKKLFTRAELRAIDDLIGEFRRRSLTESVTAGGTGAAWEASRAQARAGLHKQLLRAVPQSRIWRAHAVELLTKLDKIAAAELRPPFAGTGTIVIGTLPDNHAAQTFQPPYPLHDVSRNDFANYPELRDQSFAVPGIGHLINDLQLAYDDSTSVLNGIFGLYAIIFTWSRAGCGINYTLPAQGRLRITGTLQNFHTRVSLALDDNFGFSHGRVSATASGYVEIVRGRNVTTLAQTIASKTLKSDGDDVSTTLPHIDTEVPFTIDVTTDEVFSAGANVQILAGSEFFSSCTLDDMKATVKGLLWTRLQNLTVEVV